MGLEVSPSSQSSPLREGLEVRESSRREGEGHPTWPLGPGFGGAWGPYPMPPCGAKAPHISRGHPRGDPARAKLRFRAFPGLGAKPPPTPPGPSAPAPPHSPGGPKRASLRDLAFWPFLGGQEGITNLALVVDYPPTSSRAF